MAEMLLINPRRRRKARRANPVRKARRAAAPIARARRRRRANPIALAGVTRRTRRRNPIARARKRVMSRRRRNPISLGGGSSYMTIVRDALIGGAGAVAFDAAFGQINKYLPASMQTVPGSVGAGDAVKAIITVAVGKLLSKPTRGMSVKAAQASLIVQAHGIIKGFVPATVPMGYYSPARIAQGTNRVGPIRQGVNAYQRPGGSTPLLSAYMPSNVTPLLNGARQREGVTALR